MVVHRSADVTTPAPNAAQAARSPTSIRQMDDTDLVAQLVQLASELGPGLEPAGATDHLRDVVDTVRDLLGAAACSIAVVDNYQEELVFLAATGPGADQVVSSSMPLSKGIAGWVVASGQALTISNTKQDTRFADDFAASTGYVPTSILAVPLQTADDVLGVLEVLDAEVEPDASTSRLLELLARQATLTLQTMAVFEDLGMALLRALGKAAQDDGDLAVALEATAAELRGPTRALSELAGLFYSLGRLGQEERTAAIRILGSFVAYAKMAAPQP